MKPIAKSLIRTARDVRLLRLDRRRILVVSFDSSGAIGSKVLDQVKCPPHMVGRFAARVALMETIATGAKPICVAAPLAVEPTPAGKSILSGIRYEMKYAGLNSHTPIVDSTEKNFRTKQTGVGVTVVGLVETTCLKVGRCAPGDDVFAIGVPCVGADVPSAERRHTIADSRDVCTLVNQDSVHELIPVGSKGIIHEAKVMATDSNLQFKAHKHTHVLTKSAGPATVILLAGTVALRRILDHNRKPVTRVGALTS